MLRSVLLVILPLLSFVLVTFITMQLIELVSRRRVRGRIYDSIRQQVESAAVARELRRPLTQRLLRPLIYHLNEGLKNLLPGKAADDLRLKLERAGNPLGLTPATYMALRILLVLGAFVASLHVPALIHADRLTVFLIMLGLPIAALLVPEHMLDSARRNRQRAILKALPDALDLLVVSVEAGTGLDGAVTWLVRRTRGPLAEEFSRVLSEIRLGKARMQAWEEMARRVDLSELYSFVAAVRQAEELGVSLGRALRTQADVIRTQRAQKVRELASALPVKMLFPLIFCIFPALFVVILGPGAMTIMEALKYMQP